MQDDFEFGIRDFWVATCESDDGGYGWVREALVEDLVADVAGAAGQDDLHYCIHRIGGDTGNEKRVNIEEQAIYKCPSSCGYIDVDTNKASRDAAAKA